MWAVRDDATCDLSIASRDVNGAGMLRFFAALILLTSVALAERPATWAQPVTGTTVKNLNRVTPQLYRSAQPDAAGMREIEKLGVRTVIDLRDLNDDKDEARGTKLRPRRRARGTYQRRWRNRWRDAR